MPYELDEALDNAGTLLKELAKATKVDSEGGKKIVMSEVFTILQNLGVEVVRDISD